jgi:SPP1 gp7 family putative phage head morphogenesis protein
MNVNTDIYDKSVHRSAMIRLFEDKVSGDLIVELDGHTERLDSLIKRSKIRGTLPDTFYEALDKELVKTFGNAKNISERHLIDLHHDQSSFTMNNLSSKVGQIWAVQRPPVRVAEEIVLKRPLYNDLTLAQGWLNISIGERKRIEQVLRKGIADGLTEDELAKLVMKSNIASVTKNQALGLSRTAITSVAAQSDQQVYEANKDLLKGWQYVAVLDSRTTPLCAHRDGTIYPVTDTEHLPPAHWHCRSSTTPVVKSYSDLLKSDNILHIRKRNLEGLTEEQIRYYDGQTPIKESYNDWLKRQPYEVQLQHLGDIQRLNAFQSGQLTVDKFTNSNGEAISLRKLRELTEPDMGIPGESRRFANAKQRLDTITLGASRPEDFIDNPELEKALAEYYKLQAGDLNGTLSLTNFRGTLIGNKKATKTRVLSSPPTEAQLKYNPITQNYEDVRRYAPNPAVLANNLRLVQESKLLKDADKALINRVVGSLEDSMSVNERAVVADNLRIVFTRFRDNLEPWGNFKAVLNSQIKFDVMNVSDYIETNLRKDGNLLVRLGKEEFIDPVLGEIQLQNLHDSFITNIKAKNDWEDKVAPKIGRELQGFLDTKIPLKIRTRISGKDLDQFYLRFAHRLAISDMPDRDQFAVDLGRDLYNMANWRGSRREWYSLGLKLLDDANDKGFYTLETYGVQKRRMKSRLGNHYFGPYYDTFSVNLRVVDPRIKEYSTLTRKVDLGLRVANLEDTNRLFFKEGYKTYFTKNGILGDYDTRIPVTSTSSFNDFPEELIDADMTDALNWAANSKYKIDPEFHDFIETLLNFQDDRGNAKLYNDLNIYREYIVSRGDAYERFKAMKWLRNNDASFSNIPFLDHRARIYERGLIGPQAGETFRPFLNTSHSVSLKKEGYLNFKDQVGAFLGGASDRLEGNFNSLSVLGRQRIAEAWNKELVELGNHIIRAKPSDIRAVLTSKFVQEIDGEEQGKLFRFALEAARIDNYLKGDYSNLDLLDGYKTALALEQDASSSGAQIIAITTKNKQLAELSNVIPTTQKKRLYDEIAAATFKDPRFIEMNKRLNLTEKDLRKAAKAQNMVGKLPCINPVNSGKLLYLLLKDNPEPSLERNLFEGATTKIYDPDRIM